MKKVFLVLSLYLSAYLLLISCQTVPTKPTPAPAPVVVQPQPPTTTPSPITTPSLILAWEKNHPEKTAWSAELRKQISLALPTMVKATDWGNYCSNFYSLTDDQKIEAIANMTVAITLYESSYDASAISPDDVDGTASIGLFQLSYEDNMKWCSMSASAKNLTDPLVNIDCAIPEMAYLINKDAVVALGQSSGSRRGLARYWSTMWPKEHLSDIQAAVKKLSFCN